MYRETLFDAAGSLRADYEGLDWTRTALGAPSSWSPALRTAVDLTLHTRFGVTLLWGPEFVLVYNEAYVPLLADKHPGALGRPCREVFPEAWGVIGPMLESVYTGGEATMDRDAYLPLQRRGRLEAAYFDFAYSAVRSDDGLIEGVIDITAETTARVVTTRRMRTLTALHELIARVEGAARLRERAVDLLREDAEDFPSVSLQPASGLVVADSDAGRTARLPVGGDGTVLVVRLNEQVDEEDHLGYLQLVAFTLGQALDRLSARETERDHAQLQRLMSETLQHSFLTRPDGLSEDLVATRYEPAAELAQVGGDWHDAFRLPDRTVLLTIGDVSGHDRLAAAAMAQVKTMARTLAATRADESPGAVLRVLDEAMQTLSLDVFASAILARLEPVDGGHRLRWSNAGHPPPVLIGADGATSVLERPADLMAGVTTPERHDHELHLPAGSSLVLFTDGLIERRHVPIDDRLDLLTDLLRDRQDLPAGELADLVVERFGRECEDDVAVMAVSTPR